MTERAKSETCAGHDDAPFRSSKSADLSGYEVVGRTVTIDASPEEIDRYFADPMRLNGILGDRMRVEPAGNGNLLWVLEASGQTIRLDVRLVNERQGEIRTWRSAEDAEFDVEIKLELRPAPVGRGSEVAVLVAYRPKWGKLGNLAAWLRGVDPKLQGRQALKRLKMLLETGEIATSSNRKVQ